jgi:phosphopentomutase
MGLARVKRVVLLVLDSVGCGELPDAAAYGDQGSNTLGNLARRVGGMQLPNLGRLGLGNVTDILGVPPRGADGAFGKMAEASRGKDTTTGHWELAGLRVDTAFATFPDGFPPEILDEFTRRTGRGVLGNKAASGTEIIKELGEEHVRTGKPIVYTSADSVFQIAAHEGVIPVDELYGMSRIAREILDPYQVGRVIARPFVGAGAADFKRTYNRKDFAMIPPRPTVLDALAAAGVPVVGVGKIDDIYAGHGITRAIHTEGNADGLARTLVLLDEVPEGLLFNNLVDFDMLYGHRRDADGYYACLKQFDAFVPLLERKLREGDLVVVTADHGNDPTYRGTDHTREYVPLLAFGPSCGAGRDLDTRSTFADVGATLAEIFGVPPPPTGTSFLPQIA